MGKKGALWAKRGLFAHACGRPWKPIKNVNRPTARDAEERVH